MGSVVGLLFGLGLLLIWSSTWAPAPRRNRRPWLGPLAREAGLGEVRPGGFALVCVVAALTSTVIVLVASRTLPVALVFGAMGGYLPIAVLKARARRRSRELAEVWPEAVDNLASAVRDVLARGFVGAGRSRS
jgi:tight adherence protein B